SIKQALDRDSQEPRAVLIYAHLLTAAGRTEEAIEQYRWFVRHYNRTQPTDAETLTTIGEGAAQYARWNSVPAVFKFIVNTLCVDAVKDQPDYWPALLLSGELLMEKYNRAQALPELQAVLAINPRCAAAHTALAQLELAEYRLQKAEEHVDEALRHNPAYPPALRLRADLALLGDDHELARPFIEQALQVNPIDQQTLARLAICDLLTDGVPSANELNELLSNLRSPESWGDLKDSRFVKTLAQLLERNPRPGLFLGDVGDLLDSRRKFDQAEVFYRTAMHVMPQLAGPQSALGLLYMRTGEVDRAREVLDSAFKADPFHVRVSNMRKLIDVLSTYETIESDHFVVYCDPQERVLGQEMSAYLERIYPELVAQFDYEPPHRTHFEIYSDAKDQNAHAWFSTRMSGLPWIQTVGASTGMIVALASPEKTQQKFNWARVLKHEFVHILTLQKTGFNMPHWYTEALAVMSEGDELPDPWFDLLLSRVPAGETFNLDTINQGFQRPKTADDWTMAYCQSLLYARYFIKAFGEDALTRLTAAYSADPKTSVAIPQAFGVSVEKVEAGYIQYLNELVSQIAEGRLPGPPALAAAQQDVDAHPEDAHAQGRLAYARIARRQIDEGFQAAEAAHKLDPKEPYSATFLARRELLRGETEKALELLTPALAMPEPPALLLDVRADIAFRQQQPAEAAHVLADVVKRYPLELDPLKKYVRALTESGKPEVEIKPHLVSIAERDYDDVASRKRLARLALVEQDWSAAIRWGEETLFIDTLDADLQRLVGQAADKAGQFDRATQALQTLDTLGVLSDRERLRWGQLLKKSGRKNAARQQWIKISSDSDVYREAQTEIKLLSL
ncbi:MAG: tetratricopeptide repeat protein, partial [Planctomycetaceae bacterium]|nr:tetratricopeptide repeat protein [Planctomycetaceae bacterium]